MSYFAVFLCGSAPLRENCCTKEVISRKDAKTQRRKGAKTREVKLRHCRFAEGLDCQGVKLPADAVDVREGQRARMRPIR